MARRIGSQTRELLKDSGYILDGRFKRAVILKNKEDGGRELWYANDSHAGYTIQIGRWGYEFGRDYPASLNS